MRRSPERREAIPFAAAGPGFGDVGRRALRHFKPLYAQVLLGIVFGTVIGAIWPEFGQALKPLGDAFIGLIKLIIAPVIFCTVAVGIAQMGDIKKFGRVGGKALLYFEVVSFCALLIGLAVGFVVGPGRGFAIDPATLDPAIAASYVQQAAHSESGGDHLIHIIPDTFFGAFASGDVLQVLFIAILTGFACSRLGEGGARAVRAIDSASQIFFSIIHIVVRAAPVGAFGAMAFTIGRYGLASLLPLATLVLAFYATSAIFVLGVLGTIARWSGFPLLRFLAYIREELLIVLGAASSEAVLPQIMEKLERLGVSKSIVGLVVPTGYSFNPDGSSIYMTLAALFLAQATGTHLSFAQVAMLLAVAMLTSKGASGVTGAGFIGLAATLAVVPDIPIQSLALLVGIDRFMSAGRALVNLIGNGVATLVIARWENEIDVDKLRTELARGPTQAETARDQEEL